MADQRSEKPPFGKVTASVYRKEIATGKGWVGSGSDREYVTHSPAAIELRKQKLAEYDAWIAARGTTRCGKWAKQLQTTTNAIKEDTTKLVATTDAIDARTAAIYTEVQQLRKEVQGYAEKVQVNTQPSPNMIRIATEMTGPSVPVKVLNAILQSQGLSCPGSKQDKAAFLCEKFEGREKELRDLIFEKKNLHAQAEKKRIEKKESKASNATKRKAPPPQSDSDSANESARDQAQSAVKPTEPQNTRDECIEGQGEEKKAEEAQTACASKRAKLSPTGSDYSDYSDSENESARDQAQSAVKPTEPKEKKAEEAQTACAPQAGPTGSDYSDYSDEEEKPIAPTVESPEQRQAAMDWQAKMQKKQEELDANNKSPDANRVHCPAGCEPQMNFPSGYSKAAMAE